eukprot:502293-Amphidinium_carterae.1
MAARRSSHRTAPHLRAVRERRLRRVLTFRSLAGSTCRQELIAFTDASWGSTYSTNPNAVEQQLDGSVATRSHIGYLAFAGPIIKLPLLSHKTSLKNTDGRSTTCTGGVLQQRSWQTPHQGETLRGTSNHPRQPLLEAATRTGEDAEETMQMPPVHSEEGVDS